MPMTGSYSPQSHGAEPGPDLASSSEVCTRILKQAAQARAALRLLQAAAAGDSEQIDAQLADRWQPGVAAIVCAVDQGQR